MADDQEVPVVSYREEQPVCVATEALLSNLREEAVSAQRLAVSRLARKYVPGRMELAVAEFGRKMCAEKMFNVNKLVEWFEGDPDVIVEALAAGRLRCRLSAAMGLGKSTKLASYIARMMGFRVLHVALDADALQQMAVYIRGSGIGRISRRWPRSSKGQVNCMTYGDFNSHMYSPRRSDLFKSFDLIIFDEGFASSADVFAAKKFFSNYALAETNLIVCSATISKEATPEEMGSRAMGVFRQIEEPVTLEYAIESGKLVKDYLVDRSMVVLPTNDQIDDLVAHYKQHGVDVKSLDDAANYEMLTDVNQWLDGDATVPRVVVVHSAYAIAFNFAVSYVVIWPYEAEYVYEGDVIRQVLTPMSEEMVVQAKARSGRGIVDGSGGVIMSPERSIAVEITEAQKMEAFVKLCAGSVKPLQAGFWAKCYEVFPDALTVSTALNILKICMPVEVVVKYLGSDGRIASRFCRALSAFSQPDHFPLASGDEFPVSHAHWVREYVGLGDSPGDGHEEIRVPFLAEGELKVVLAAIEMMAQYRMDIARWRPSRQFAIGDGYDSEEEIKDSRYARVIRLRRVEDAPVPTLMSAPKIKTIPWSYKADRENAVPQRSGGYINSDRCKEALLELERSLQEYSVPVADVTEVIETEEGTVAPIVVVGFGNVESPGGSIVCTLPIRICEKINLGQDLVGTEFQRLMTAARADSARFVASKLFDCFASPWDSILNSLLDESVVRSLVKAGVSSDTYAMVDQMRERFACELGSILANSYVFKKQFLKVIKRSPSMDDVMHAVKRGRFDGIAQTDNFICRVKALKSKIDDVLITAESNNVFLPTYITNAQRALPLRGSSSLGYVGENMVALPRGAAKRIEQVSHGRTGSQGFGKRDGW